MLGLLQVTGRTVDDTTAMPPWKKAKFSAESQQTGQMHRQWWVPASTCPAWSLAVANELLDDLARYHIIAERSSYATSDSFQCILSTPVMHISFDGMSEPV